MKRFLLTLFVCGICAACGSRQAENVVITESSDVLLISDTSGVSLLTDTVRLGQMHQGEVVRRDMSLKNGTTKPLVVLSVSTSCGCTSVEFPKQPILPGKTAPFSFELDSRGFVGVQYKRIIIRTSESANAYVLVVVADIIQ